MGGSMGGGFVVVAAMLLILVLIVNTPKVKKKSGPKTDVSQKPTRNGKRFSSLRNRNNTDGK